MDDILEIKNLCSRMQPEARHLILKMARLYFVRWPVATTGKQHLSLLLLKESLVQQSLGDGQRVINDGLCSRMTPACLTENCQYA